MIFMYMYVRVMVCLSKMMRSQGHVYAVGIAYCPLFWEVSTCSPWLHAYMHMLVADVGAKTAYCLLFWEVSTCDLYVCVRSCYSMPC